MAALFFLFSSPASLDASELPQDEAGDSSATADLATDESAESELEEPPADDAQAPETSGELLAVPQRPAEQEPQFILPVSWRVGSISEASGADAAADQDERTDLEIQIDAAFGKVVGAMYTVLFFDVFPENIKRRFVSNAEVSVFYVHELSLELAGELAEAAVERAELDRWLAEAEAPAGARWMPMSVARYDVDDGDRSVVGWRPVLVHEEHALEPSDWETTALDSDGTSFSIWLEWRFTEPEFLERWTTSNLGRSIAVANDGEVQSVLRIEEPSSTGTLRLDLPAWDDAARSLREHRDVGVFIRADRIPGPQMPFIVIWIMIGAITLTLRMGFINLRGFGHAIKVLRGKYDCSDGEGEVSHLQALASALSATVGLGNIAGVALAVAVGGPGAVFWMLVASFFGMSTKFVECTLGHHYRDIDENGKVLGGPMMYLQKGLKERNLGPLGKGLAIMFMLFCIGGSFGGGNMFQSNQAYAAVNAATPFHVSSTLFGLFMVVLVGIVIIGGIQRIAVAASAIVPLMCTLYVLAAVVVLVIRADTVPYAFYHILHGAFSGSAVYGGAVGAIVVGFQRAAFSNEAGIGSAPIAHSASKSSESIRVGMVALLEPFIDTFIVCLATGLVIVVSGILDDPAGLSIVGEGALLTSAAFGSVLSWLPLALTVTIVLFAYSTTLSWSYYGERCWVGLFGDKYSTIYRVIFLFFVFLGAVTSLGSVIDFSDLMILSMAFPNIFGLYFMVGKVRKMSEDYRSRMAVIDEAAAE